MLPLLISIDVFSKALAFVAAASLRDECAQSPAVSAPC